MPTSKPTTCYSVCIEVSDGKPRNSTKNRYEFDCLPLNDGTYKVLYDSLGIGILQQKTNLAWHWKEGILSQQYADLIGEQIDKYKEDNNESIIQPS
ncbi:MAG: hypothetical protein JWN56_1905 [Sphingobacteriales bacterium]|nr:hypothetical protein [Sphingobacteriales bacterium]